MSFFAVCILGYINADIALMALHAVDVVLQSKRDRLATG
jgi:hypothetical protein